MMLLMRPAAGPKTMLMHSSQVLALVYLKPWQRIILETQETTPEPQRSSRKKKRPMLLACAWHMVKLIPVVAMVSSRMLPLMFPGSMVLKVLWNQLLLLVEGIWVEVSSSYFPFIYNKFYYLIYYNKSWFWNLFFLLLSPSFYSSNSQPPLRSNSNRNWENQPEMPWVIFWLFLVCMNRNISTNNSTNWLISI